MKTLNSVTTKHKLLLSAVIIMTGLMAFYCSNRPQPLQPDTKAPGAATITVKTGKVGSLAKAADISLSKLCVSLSAEDETTVYDTIAMSGNGSTTVTKTYGNLASMKTWILAVKTLDSKDSLIHGGSTAFDVRPGQTANVSLDLQSRFSMLKANFSPIRDSVTRCELLLDGIKVDDSSFAKQSAVGDTIKLVCDYLKTNVSQRIRMDVYGIMWGYDTLLYTGDTAITPLPGVNSSYKITLKWVGPALPPSGQATMSVILGAVGTTTVNGVLKNYTLPTSAIDIRLGVKGYGVLVDGNMAYIIAGTTFEVWNVSNPQSPSKLGSVTHGYTDLRVEDHAIYNNIVWCVRSSSGGYGSATYIFGVDVSNPANPVLRGTLTLQTGSSLISNCSAIYSGHLLVHDYSRNLIYVINISDPDAPTVYSQWSVPNMVNSGPGWMLVDGSLLYLPCRENRLFKIYNLNNLADVIEVGSVATANYLSGPVVKIGSYAYISVDYIGGVAVDVSNPAAPAIAGNFNVNAGYFKAKNGKLFSIQDMYTTTSNRVYAYSLANPAAPAIEDSSSVANPAGTTAVRFMGSTVTSANWVGNYLIGYSSTDIPALSGVRALYFPVN